MAAGLSGRKAQAARNDEVILEAARQVFLADPGAPIAAVAERAKVGISALYRRYRSKDELLLRLSVDAIKQYADIAEAALARDEGPWEDFVSFMREAVDARSGSLTVRLAGAFTVTRELMDELPRAVEASRRLLENAKAAGAVRKDIEIGDISLLLEQLQSVELGDDRRNRELRHRYLKIILDGLHVVEAGELPGPAPSWEEIGGRYGRK